jgi:hypothetical protein
LGFKGGRPYIYPKINPGGITKEIMFQMAKPNLLFKTLVWAWQKSLGGIPHTHIMFAGEEGKKIERQTVCRDWTFKKKVISYLVLFHRKKS